MGACRNNVPCTGTVSAKALGRGRSWHVGGAERSALCSEHCDQWGGGRLGAGEITRSRKRLLLKNKCPGYS